MAVSAAQVAAQPMDRSGYIKANYNKAEYRIKMRDGAELHTSVFIPKDTSQQYPILLNRTPYSCRPYGAEMHRNLGPSGYLEKEGYITGFSVAPSTTGPGDVLTVTMKYSADRHRTISGLRRISTPGLRVYRKGNAIPRVLGGLGVAVLSTSNGLMTDRDARKRNVGGEVLCYVW